MNREILELAQKLKSASNNNGSFYTQLAYVLYSGGAIAEIEKLEKMAGIKK